jgi:phosphate transport system permease protein
LPGILLALARSAGETAPLLFTAFGSMYLSFDPTAPMAALPVEIYNYAISPYQDWHELAWTGSLVLIFLVFVLNISSKIIVHGNLKNIFKRVQK